MAWLYEPFEVIYVEQVVDPQSLFWSYRLEPDPWGNPLDILIAAEEGDEDAMNLTDFLYHEGE